MSWSIREVVILLVVDGCRVSLAHASSLTFYLAEFECSNSLTMIVFWMRQIKTGVPRTITITETRVLLCHGFNEKHACLSGNGK